MVLVDQRHYKPDSRRDRARQLTEAFPWDGAPKYLIRDRDRIYDAVVTPLLRAMGIRDKPTAPARALAEWRCRTADQIDPARVSPSRHHPGRNTFASDSAIVRNVLQ